MNMKSILLASAAAVVATSAFAADAMKKEVAPAAANYVKVCDAMGAGYFFIPGSADTCLKISGRVRAGVTFGTNSHAGKAFTDGRVEFAIAQSTELGKSVAAIRFAYDGSSSSTVKADEAYISVGDFSVGGNIADTTIFDLGTNGDMSFNLNNNLGRLGDNNMGVRYNHDFGGGISVALGAEGGSTVYTFAPVTSASNKPVVSGSVTYASGAIKGITLAAGYDTASQSQAGGYGLALKGEYAVSDALSVLGGASAGRVNNLAVYNGILGASYTINKKVSVYADALVGKKGTSSVFGANAGAVYTIATNLTLEGEEQFLRTGSSADWTSLVRLKRAF